VPVVDQVVVREITDNQHNIFLKPLKRSGLVVQRTGFPSWPVMPAMCGIRSRHRQIIPGVQCPITV